MQKLMKLVLLESETLEDWKDIQLKLSVSLEFVLVYHESNRTVIFEARWREIFEKTKSNFCVLAIYAHVLVCGLPLEGAHRE